MYKWSNNIAVANAIASMAFTPSDTTLVVFILKAICSYSGAPTGGKLEIVERDAGDTTDANILFSVDIASAGVTPVNLDYPVNNVNAGRKVIARLSAGGSGVIGKVNVLSRTGQLV